jgi:S-adenosylmethionine-dependent methyltransferase
VASSASIRLTPARQRVLWRSLVSVLAAPEGRSVLDCGGGTGTLAVPMAELGAQVTVVDISVDALATLTRRAAEAGVGDRVHAVQGDIESLADVVPVASFDLVVAHGLLESVDDPVAALTALAAAVRPGGLVSVVVANPVAAVLARVLAGDLASARTILDAQLGSAGSALPVEQLCSNVGLVVEQVQGVGVFTEFAGSEDGDGRLAELEELAATLVPYRDIAARRHVLARRPS